jgi:dipeptidyl aminopeptidase/acylaminoacyl peptidase
MDAQVMRQVAWIGEEYLRGPAKGIVLSFHGLGGGAGKTTPSTEELEWAYAGGIVVYPLYGPWAWMNAQAQAMTDELVEAAWREFALPAGAPLICTGGSMGGQASLLYTRYARRPVAACLANCPVCDLKYHFNERPDLPPTIRHAFAAYGGDLDAALERHSPLAQAAAMPDIPYLIIHGLKDPAVSKANHSDPMVAALRARGLRVEYHEVPDMRHCGPMPLKTLQREVEFVAGSLAGKPAR